jgi:hypothetical protein
MMFGRPFLVRLSLACVCVGYAEPQVGYFVVFVVANFVIFQPWELDNTKVVPASSVPTLILSLSPSATLPVCLSGCLWLPFCLSSLVVVHSKLMTC